MAARVSATSSQSKVQSLDFLKRNFVQCINNYVSAVQTSILTERNETTVEIIYHSAVTFLTQSIPDLTYQPITPPQLFPGSSTFTPVVVTQTSSAFNRVQPIENPSIQSSARSTPITPVQAVANPSIHSSARSTPISTPSTPLEEVRQTTTFISTLTTVAESANVTTQAATAATAAAAVTPPPTALSASALSRPLKDVRQRKTFTAQIRADQSALQIWDVQLLPGGRLVLADGENDCVKLFDTQGQHLHTLECRSEPCRLAVLDISATSHTVALTMPNCRCIDLLEIGVNIMKVKKTLQTSRRYGAVAAVNNQTLAVGYCGRRNPVIDLIDLGGQVLRQICSSVQPSYMDRTEDGGLAFSTIDGKIARVKVDTGTVIFNKSVPQIEDPRGVAISLDGSILVTDMDKKTLHLVSSQGVWIKKLWSAPSDGDQGDYLWSVSTDGSTCVCGTMRGTVYILDCL